MISKLYNSIAFRLTLWFTAIFTICTSIVVILFYFLATQTIQKQIDQELLDNAAKFSTIIQRNGLLGARELAVLEAQAAGEKVIFFRLVYPTGEVFATSHMAYWKHVNVSKEALSHLINTKQNFFETILLSPHNHKARILYSYVANNAILQTGVAIGFYTKFLATFKLVFLSVMIFIVLFSAISSWLLVQKALSAVKTITKTASDISGSNLDIRVKGSGNKDELDHLANTFNQMLDRIQELIKGIREISDNIAHDLKSPITRIRGFAELSLTQQESLEDYRAMAANTIEESDRLLDMINTMLVISQTEAGEGEFEYRKTDLSLMIKNACELFSALAEDKNIEFSRTIENRLMVNGDIKMLQRAISNIFDNAIKYTPVDGKIEVIVYSDSKVINIKVKDTGIGIDSKFHEKIFDRFYRAESSRTESGSGLGLSLARTIVRQHRGDIVVVNNTNVGSTFWMTLPINNL